MYIGLWLHLQIVERQFSKPICTTQILAECIIQNSV